MQIITRGNRSSFVHFWNNMLSIIGHLFGSIYTSLKIKEGKKPGKFSYRDILAKVENKQSCWYINCTCPKLLYSHYSVGRALKNSFLQWTETNAETHHKISCENRANFLPCIAAFWSVYFWPITILISNVCRFISLFYVFRSRTAEINLVLLSFLKSQK